jgi:hypothetical protein
LQWLRRLRKGRHNRDELVGCDGCDGCNADELCNRDMISCDGCDAKLCNRKASRLQRLLTVASQTRSWSVATVALLDFATAKTDHMDIQISMVYFGLET